MSLPKENLQQKLSDIRGLTLNANELISVVTDASWFRTRAVGALTNVCISAAHCAINAGVGPKTAIEALQEAVKHLTVEDEGGFFNE